MGNTTTIAALQTIAKAITVERMQVIRSFEAQVKSDAVRDIVGVALDMSRATGVLDELLNHVTDLLDQYDPDHLRPRQ